jgi:hypothetical protein
VKPILVAVAVTALGSVGAVVYVGHRLMEPTVVADPYEAGLHYDHAARDSSARLERSDAAARPSTPGPAGAGPYARGERDGATACDLATSPCTAAVDGATIALALSPRPVRSMRDLELAVDVRRDGSPLADRVVEVTLTMPGMYMGDGRVRLASLGGGRYLGRGVLVRCPSGRRTWKAEVTVASLEPATSTPLTAAFTFDVAD